MTLPPILAAVRAHLEARAEGGATFPEPSPTEVKALARWLCDHFMKRANQFDRDSEWSDYSSRWKVVARALLATLLGAKEQDHG